MEAHSSVALTETTVVKQSQCMFKLRYTDSVQQSPLREYYSTSTGQGTSPFMEIIVLSLSVSLLHPPLGSTTQFRPWPPHQSPLPCSKKGLGPILS
jgi:hypothetical protein